MKTLLWTADSPFSRIVLWSAYHLRVEQELRFEHLGWNELKPIVPGGRLGAPATVPCLEFNANVHVSDSLRILSSFLASAFAEWFMSPDGELYRLTEGQFNRVMYALYDAPNDEKLEKVRTLWQRALAAAEVAITHPRFDETSTPDNESSRGQVHKTNVSLGLIALHTLTQFCLFLRPDWRDDIPKKIAECLSAAEMSDSFKAMNAAVSAHNQRVPCGGLGC